MIGWRITTNAKLRENKKEWNGRQERAEASSRKQAQTTPEAKRAGWLSASGLAQGQGYTPGSVEKLSTCLCGEGQVLIRNDATDTCSICFNAFPKKWLYLLKVTWILLTNFQISLRFQRLFPCLESWWTATLWPQATQLYTPLSGSSTDDLQLKQTANIKLQEKGIATAKPSLCELEGQNKHVMISHHFVQRKSGWNEY